MITIKNTFMCVPLMEHKFIYLITHKKAREKKQIEFTQQQVCVVYTMTRSHAK